jgi:simple sugar transport system permease protein
MDGISSFLASTLSLATPTLLAALGILVSERSGVLNIGTEGMMLVGALGGVLGSYYTGSVWLGTLIGIVVTVAFAAVFGVFAVLVKADQTVVGTGMNILASGLTITVNRAVFGASMSPPIIDTFDKVAIPLLKDIPILGPSLFTQTIPGYLAFVMVIATSFFLFRTNTGLKVRSVGENPQACDTVGINVSKVRFLAVLYSGILAGLAGAFISMGQLSFFTEGMIAGGGFMAVAAVVFGNYTPLGVLGASLVFGLSNASSYRLQALSTGIPSEFPNMLPYIITIIALCVTSRRSKKPASSAQPYIKA